MDSGELLLPLALHMVLTGLPLVAASLFAASKGVRQVPVLLAVGLAASGMVGLLAFWCYFGDPVLGETFSWCVVLGSALLIAWLLYGGRVDRGLLGALATPLGLWAIGSTFLLFLGFVHGGAAEPLATATTRFSGPLPADNAIPSFFADWFYANGHDGVPPVFPGEWLSSDRPPLQIGYALAQRPFGWNANGLDYQVMGVLLQQLWIVGLWALLVAARVGRVSRALAMIAVLASPLAIVNGFFVWPKLLPAAMLLAVAALVLTPLWQQLRRSLWAAVLIAALCGLGMMGHGSSVFGILPLAAVVAYRGLPSWRWLGAGLAVGVAIMASWSAYQKYENPPGNRLTKWTLAGVVEIDDRGTSEAIFDAYGEAGVGGTLHNKVQNFITISGGGPALEALENGFDTGEIEQIIGAFRFVFFLYLLPSLGLLLLAPLAMAMGRRRARDPAEWSFALTCFVVFGLGIVPWGLLIFGSEEIRAVIHVGSYLLPILAMSGAVVGLRSVFPRFALVLVGILSLFHLALYAPALTPPVGSDYSTLAVLIVAASVGGFVGLALRGDAGREPLVAAQAG